MPKNMKEPIVESQNYALGVMHVNMNIHDPNRMKTPQLGLPYQKFRLFYDFGTK